MRRLSTDRVLTDETRFALVERILELWHLILGVALDAVHLADIVEGTRRRRLVKVLGTRSTNTHTKRQCDCCSGRQYSRSGCARVGLWERRCPCRLCSSDIT